MLVPSLVCLTIWIWSMISTGGLIFPWPLFVIIGTGGYLSRLVFGRESAIEEEREKLRKKQARSLAIQQEAAAPASRRRHSTTTPARPGAEPRPLALSGDCSSRHVRFPQWSTEPTMCVSGGDAELAKSENLGHTVPMQFLAVIIA